MARKGRGGSMRTPDIYVGGVLMEPGLYLPTGSDVLVEDKPDKDDGYAYYDGETLTLRNYHYVGPGRRVGDMCVGIDVSNATTEIYYKGDNCITVTGEERGVALLVNDGKVIVGGRGELALYAEESRLCNFGVLGNGTFKVVSGTVRLHANAGEYTLGENGEKVFLADSYAMKVEKFIARLARIRGRDDDDDDDDKPKSARSVKPDENEESGTEMNRNNETEVIIDFPKLIFWWLRRYWGPLLLLLLAIIAALVAIWAVFLRNPEILEPDFALLDLEENAVQMGDSGKPAESTAGGGAVVLNYTYDVTVSLSGETASMYFGLPSKSNREAVLQLVVGNTLLAQSGRLPPGYEVSQLDLEPGATSQLQPGVYKGELRVYYYNEQTGERAILDTVIEVTVTVTN